MKIGRWKRYRPARTVWLHLLLPYGHVGRPDEQGTVLPSPSALATSQSKALDVPSGDRESPMTTNPGLTTRHSQLSIVNSRVTVCCHLMRRKGDRNQLGVTISCEALGAK